MKKSSYHLIIKGKVQGVYYRDWTRGEAQKLRIVGWVRNLDNGDVEARIEGSSDNVNKLIELCYQGSPNSNVTSIDKEVVKLEGFTKFEVRR